VLSAAALLATAGCGADERPARDTGSATVRIERVAFAARQHLAQQSAFVITVRNAGDSAIARLGVTLTGLTRRDSDGTDQPLWIVDAAPPGVVAASGDTRTTGPLAPGKQTTLRWLLTPAAAGTHRLRYDVSAGASTQLAGGGEPRGTLNVSVSAKPAFARVDPRTGRVVRE
jgi:hypothetical protein